MEASLAANLVDSVFQSVWRVGNAAQIRTTLHRPELDSSAAYLTSPLAGVTFPASSQEQEQDCHVREGKKEGFALDGEQGKFATKLAKKRHKTTFLQQT